jgi:hypothetical protein
MSLPEIKVLQSLDFSWYTGLVLDCARTKACFVSTLQIARLLRSHQQLKTQPDARAAGWMKLSGWGTGIEFSL